MKSFLISCAYNVLYVLFLIISLPMYLIKMYRRKGYGTGMLERFGIYKKPLKDEPQGGIYVHAVSVGEVLIALKWIRAWLKQNGGSVVLATTTPTGHAVARAQAPEGVRVLYSPLDLPGLPGRCLNRFHPKIIILIEAELWPNMAKAAHKRGIKHVMLNARLSPKSERHYRLAGALSHWFFSFLDGMAAQDEADARRFAGIGVSADKITVTGSIKFDDTDDLIPQKRDEFTALLNQYAQGKPIVLAASTHDGEELIIAQSILNAGGFPLLVPRHAERRATIVKELSSVDIKTIVRTEELKNGPTPLDPLPEKLAYMADTTGELRDWTAHADLVIIGKSFLAEGGQNPVEAVMASVPVIAGHNMQNFKALVDLLRSVHGITLIDSTELEPTIREFLTHPEKGRQQARLAHQALTAHRGATARSITLIESYLK